MNPISQLSTALSAERGALLNFVALLEREQGMLMENPPISCSNSP
ncbi:MAG: hypothetical protein OEV15_02235 [Gallionella sp.]|nr:hypothetical protein [Gallionella sp.]